MSAVEVARPAELERAEVTKRDVLHRAADILEEFGWIQCEFNANQDGTATDPRSATRHCALGAISRACVDLGLSYGDRSKFYGTNPPQGHWMSFNDRVGRTAAEVVAALRAEAEREDAA